MTVKNEENILEEALESVYLIADEIILVETGSTDKAFKIARKYPNNVHHFKRVNDMSAACNYCDSFATMDYICRWGDDWILHEGGIKKIIKLKTIQFDNADIVSFRWNVEFTDIIDTKSKCRETISYQPNFFLFHNHEFIWQSPIYNQLIQRQDIPKKR